MATLHQEPLDDFILIRTVEIDEGERLRPVDPVWADALGAMMAKDGQDTPIQVCRLPGRDRWTVVAGANRVAGAKAHDIEYLKAEVVSADRDSRRLREVRENIFRSDLTPIDRAAHIAELVEIKRRNAGLDVAAHRAAAAPKHWRAELDAEAETTLDTMSNVYGWSNEVGEQLGYSGRTIRRDLMLYRRLAPSLVEQLRNARHPILQNATHLRALAKLDPDAQRQAVDALVAGAKTVAEAVRSTGTRRPADPEAKRQSTIIATLGRMSAREMLGLFQSPAFHDAIPLEARRLLAPMRRGPERGA